MYQLKLIFGTGHIEELLTLTWINNSHARRRIP